MAGAGAAVATGLPGIIPSLPALADWWFIPYRVMHLLFEFGRTKKRRTKPWGVVYDAVTKQPLDPAYVQILDAAGQEVATRITDLEGRFGFFLPPGQYTMFANKTNYAFPSKSVRGSYDALYENIYHGEPLTVI
ncbi:MAG: carboxypeptidase-like regulatory domain-containing protein, partial [Patescibacteria group bacterium]